MRIEFGEVKIGEKAKSLIKDCLETNRITAGNKTTLFEQKWGELTDTKYNVVVNSGTSALICLLLTLYERGAKLGDEIITPALSFVSTWTSIIAAGFRPVFVDINKENLGIRDELIERHINEKTQAILGVSLMGRNYNLDKVQDLCIKYGISHFNDACEAHGTFFQSKRQEMWTDACVYSGFAAHLLYGGEYGWVSTNNSNIDTWARMARNHGRDISCDMTDFQHNSFGLNLRTTELNSSLALESIDNFHHTFNIRKKIWYQIHDTLQSYHQHYYTTDEADGRVNCPHAYSITFKNPGLVDQFKIHLKNAQIHFKRNFGAPTQHLVFKKLGLQLDKYPEAEFVGDNGVHLPCHAYLGDNDVKYMTDTIIQFMDTI